MAALSPRQIATVALVAEGLLNKQIAHRLGITEATVKAQISIVGKKIGIVSRWRIALWYIARADEAERDRLFSTVSLSARIEEKVAAGTQAVSA